MNKGRPKVPVHPPATLTLDRSHTIDWSGALWRIHRTRGAHPAAWDSLRSDGPLEAMRWDPHPSGGGPVPAHGLIPSVAYTSATIDGAFAEVFQDERAIQLTADRALSSWLPTRPLNLLDLDGSDFGVHHGAAHTLSSIDRTSITRNWARAIFVQLGDTLDGVLHQSTIIGDPVIALFTRARDSFPPEPGFSRPLTHVDVARWAARTATRLRWEIL